jgi:hypothetical protein
LGGVELSHAVIEIVSVGLWPFNKYGITGDPVTMGIEKILPWLPSYFDRQLDGQRFENISSLNRFANSLNSGAFTTGK